MPLNTFSQTEWLADARPISMGYCVYEGNECKNFTSIGGADLSGYLLRISFKKDEMIKLTLFQNGEIVENVYSTVFSWAKMTKKTFNLSCDSFQGNKFFHDPTGDSKQHSLSIDISIKTKTGKISFSYPNELRMYVYRFNIL